jgi:hypothetical protein
LIREGLALVRLDRREGAQHRRERPVRVGHRALDQARDHRRLAIIGPQVPPRIDERREPLRPDLGAPAGLERRLGGGEARGGRGADDLPAHGHRVPLAGGTLGSGSCASS